MTLLSWAWTWQWCGCGRAGVRPGAEAGQGDVYDLPGLRPAFGGDPGALLLAPNLTLSGGHRGHDRTGAAVPGAASLASGPALRSGSVRAVDSESSGAASGSTPCRCRMSSTLASSSSIPAGAGASAGGTG